jgi:hypothetical protein
MRRLSGKSSVLKALLTYAPCGYQELDSQDFIDEEITKRESMVNDPNISREPCY